MTLRLFQSLFKLEISKNSPFVTFSSINYPELNDLKDYKDRIIWVRVPKTPSHPYRFMPLVFWSKPNPRETYNIDQEKYESQTQLIANQEARIRALDLEVTQVKGDLANAKI